MERRRVRVAHGRIGDCERGCDRPVGERGIRRRVQHAPGAVADRRQRGRDLAVEAADGPDAPANDPGVRRLWMEGVELAVVDGVRPRADDLAEIREPDLIAGGAVDDVPARHARGRLDRLRQIAPADVESERCAPGTDAVTSDRPDACVDRIGSAGQPRQRDGNRNSRGLQLLVRPERAGLVEARSLRELELVAHRAAHGQPRKGRRPRELVGDGLARAEQKRPQARRCPRSGRIGPRLDAAGDGERGKADRDKADGTHH